MLLAGLAWLAWLHTAVHRPTNRSRLGKGAATLGLRRHQAAGGHLPTPPTRDLLLLPLPLLLPLLLPASPRRNCLTLALLLAALLPTSPPSSWLPLALLLTLTLLNTSSPSNLLPLALLLTLTLLRHLPLLPAPSASAAQPLPHPRPPLTPSLLSLPRAGIGRRR